MPAAISAIDTPVRAGPTVLGRIHVEAETLDEEQRMALEQSARVIDRLILRIQSYGFRIVLRIAVGAASCPTHAIDVDSLKRQALSRPLVSWRGGVHSSPDQN